MAPVSDAIIERPKVNVNLLIVKEGKVLLGKRLGKNPGSQMYGSPGGHLENLESILDCAHREIAEETGMEVENIRFLNITNVRSFPPKHYVSLSYLADWKSGEPVNMEPDRCEGWNWYALSELPNPMTPATEAAIRGYVQGALMLEATEGALIEQEMARYMPHFAHGQTYHDSVE